ncbi:hypothetical protein QOT17_008555 [Balamuthia mandrillaris]
MVRVNGQLLAKLLCLATTCLGSFVGGLFYSFALFAADLKDVEHYNQKQINLIGAICYVGAEALQWPVGILIERYGARKMAIVFSFFPIVGYTVAYVCVVYARASLLPLMAMAWAVVGLGVASFFMPSFMILRSWYRPEHKERLSGLLMVIYAVAGMVGAVVYGEIDADKKSKLEYFILSLAVSSAVCFLLNFPFLREAPSKGYHSINEDTSLLAAKQKHAKEEEELSHHEKPKASARQVFGSLWNVIRSLVVDPFFWLMFFALFVNYGTAVNFYNNAGSIALSVHGEDSDASRIILVFSAAQLVGRLLFSFLASINLLDPRNKVKIEDLTLQQQQKRANVAAMWRTVLLLVSSGILTLESFLAAFISYDVKLLYVFVSLNGLGYGGQWSMLPGVADPEVMFPGKHLSEPQLWGVILLAPAFGPLLFDLMSGSLYDKHTEPNSDNCYGHKCYAQYFLIAGLVLAATMLANVVCMALVALRMRKARRTPVYL